MELLPLGSIVQLNNGTQKIMIISRAPLYNNEGTIGYFEYSACLYPQGMINQESYFFNHSDIKTVIFKGYEDEAEEAFREMYEKQIKETPYPKLQLLVLPPNKTEEKG